jgi:hypothetical protein
VSKYFLLRAFKQVDLVEQNPKFLEEAEKSYLAGKEYEGRVAKFIPKGLQDFVPEGRREFDLSDGFVLMVSCQRRF